MHTAESLAKLIAPRVGDPAELQQLAEVMNDIEALHAKLAEQKAALWAETKDRLPVLCIYELERACGLREPKR